MAHQFCRQRKNFIAAVVLHGLFRNKLPNDRGENKKDLRYLNAFADLPEELIKEGRNKN